MRSALISASALMLALGACAPAVPDSGAGLDTYDNQRRASVDAQLEGRTNPATGRMDAPSDVNSSSLDGSGSGSGGEDRDEVAEMAAAALAREQNSGQMPLQAAPGNPTPQAVSTPGGMSSENDFDAVSSERSIEEDKEFIARNRQQYEQIRPSALPNRSGNSGPNIVEFALKTTNAVGQPQYGRSAFASKAKEQRNCRDYPSDDLAQEAFLAAGGPEKDREGLDADGDGFACGWDPTPFRRVRG